MNLLCGGLFRKSRRIFLARGRFSSPACGGIGPAPCPAAANIKRMSGQRSGQISAKAVVLQQDAAHDPQEMGGGSTSPIHCAQTGMPSKGKAKPDSRIAGSRKNIVICIA